MKTKKNVLFLLMTVLCLSTTFVFAAVPTTATNFNNATKTQALPSEVNKMNTSELLNLTPESYKAKTGKNLGFINTIKLKVAQKFIKQQAGRGGDIEKPIYIVLAILGLGFIAMGILDDWKGNDWIIGLVLSCLLWIPGVIYALIKMKKYYK